VLISSNYAEIMLRNQGLSIAVGRASGRAQDVREAVEGLMIKWAMLTGMLGFVVYAFVIA
jgi:hypothetical protein